MIRQKVYQLEQTQVKMKQECVFILFGFGRHKSAIE